MKVGAALHLSAPPRGLEPASASDREIVLTILKDTVKGKIEVIYYTISR